MGGAALRVEADADQDVEHEGVGQELEQRVEITRSAIGHAESSQAFSARWQEEPVLRLRNYMVGRGWWTKADEEELIRDVRAQVDAAVEDYLSMPPQEPAAMFDHLYETLPPSLAEQRRMVEDSDG